MTASRAYLNRRTLAEWREIGRGRLRAKPLGFGAVVLDIYDVDFTRTTSLADVATVIETALTDASDSYGWSVAYAAGVFAVSVTSGGNPNDPPLLEGSVRREDEDQHVVNWISIAQANGGATVRHGFSLAVWNNQDFTVYTDLLAEVVALGAKYHVLDRLCGVIEPGAQYSAQVSPSITCSPLGPLQLQNLTSALFNAIPDAFAALLADVAGLGGWMAPYIGAVDLAFEPSGDVPTAFEQWFAPIFEWGFTRVFVDVAGDISEDPDNPTYAALQNEKLAGHGSRYVLEPYADSATAKDWAAEGFGGLYALEANALAGLHGGKNRAASPALNFVIPSDDDSLANCKTWARRGYTVVTGLFHTVRPESESIELLNFSWDTDLFGEAFLADAGVPGIVNGFRGLDRARGGSRANSRGR